MERNTSMYRINIRYFIGYSTDAEIRYNASSGGVGTAIIKYLLDTNAFGTAMTFVYDSFLCQYQPKLIHSYSDYNNCGSIYQDTDTIGFIKANLGRIRNGIIITCMPCQVRAIKSILNRNNIDHFIISLCCSGQTTVQGTWFYFKLLGINKGDIRKIQYRGNGWPSGIQIELNNGSIINKGNYTYPWTLMYKSLLFRPKRCLSCTIKTSEEADVTLADPWLKEYLEVDNIGNSVVICNHIGFNVVNEMSKESLLRLKEVDEDTYVKSQLGTIQTKSKANTYKLFNKLIAKMSKDDSFYKRVFTSSATMMKIHCKIVSTLSLLLKR